MTFTKIEQAIDAIARGDLVIVVDDADRENEGDLIMAAEKITPEAMAFMIRSVSVFSERYTSSTGSPTRMRTSGGSVTLRTLGNRLDRGQTFSVPHIPSGMTGACDSLASRAAPNRPFSTGSKKAGHARRCLPPAYAGPARS